MKEDFATELRKVRVTKKLPHNKTEKLVEEKKHLCISQVIIEQKEKTDKKPHRQSQSVYRLVLKLLA